MLNLPVYHDFGITGAPGTRGVSRDKAGSSVMIGGEDKKTERVLMDLRRMYVPKKNIAPFRLNARSRIGGKTRSSCRSAIIGI